MHWAFLSDWTLALDLLQVGLSFEHTDHLARTPFDWLTDRLWGAVLNPATNGVLSKGGEERLIKQSEEQAMALWAQGARPHIAKIQETLRVWLSAGAFEVLPLFLDAFGPFGWMQNNATALHATVLAPATSKRTHLVKELIKVVSPNTPDDHGRTALWYAADTWLKHPDKRPGALSLMRLLVDVGEDPYREDKNGLSPLSVVQFDADNKDALASMGVSTLGALA